MSIKKTIEDIVLNTDDESITLEGVEVYEESITLCKYSIEGSNDKFIAVETEEPIEVTQLEADYMVELLKSKLIIK